MLFIPTLSFRYLASIAALVGMLLAGHANAQSITIAQVGPFTGLPSPDAHEVNAGAQAFFDSINAKGGMNGKKIDFIKFDDTFKGDVFLEKLQEAANKKALALITPIGSAAIQGALKQDVFSKYDIVVVNAIPGSDVFRNPGHPRLFHIRASDGQQITSIIRNAKTVGITSMAILHQDLPIGTAGLAKAQEIGAAQSIKVTGIQSKHDDASLAAAAPKVVATAAQSVLVIGSPKFMADAIAQLRKAGFASQAFALSYMPAGLAFKIAGEGGARGVGIAQTYPNPNSPNLGLTRDFKAVMSKYAPKVTTFTAFHLEGYISARILVEGIKRSGNTPTAERLTAALKSMGSQDLGGFTVDFSKSNSGSNFVDLAVIDSSGKLRY
jgi:branched-chain amino acid transport system substrate-binding protein